MWNQFFQRRYRKARTKWRRRPWRRRTRRPETLTSTVINRRHPLHREQTWLESALEISCGWTPTLWIETSSLITLLCLLSTISLAIMNSYGCDQFILSTSRISRKTSRCFHYVSQFSFWKKKKKNFEEKEKRWFFFSWIWVQFFCINSCTRPSS